MAAAPVLVLVDLQADYLEAPGLQPAAGDVVDGAARLLAAARARRWTVVHVLTTLRRDDDRRMPHWKRSGLWRCVEGTPGHDAPEALRPRRGEPIVHKTGWDGFASGRLARILRKSRATDVVVCGIHAHACVRQVVLGAHERGFAVTVAEDAVGSDDPPHAAVTRCYAEARGIIYRRVDDLVAVCGEAPPRPRSSSPGQRLTRGADASPAPDRPTATSPRVLRVNGRDAASWRAAPRARYPAHPASSPP